MDCLDYNMPPDSSPVYIFAMPKIYKQTARRVRGKEILWRECSGKCDELGHGGE